MQAAELFDPHLLRDLTESRLGWPHEWTIEHGPHGLPGALQLCWQPSQCCLWLADHGGFLCKLDDLDRLFEILKVEFDHPGALRKALTGTSYRWDERHRLVPKPKADFTIEELFS